MTATREILVTGGGGFIGMHMLAVRVFAIMRVLVVAHPPELDVDAFYRHAHNLGGDNACRRTRLALHRTP